MRLTGGHYDNEGTVQVCYNNLWGLIRDDGWTDGDARVVCNSLGYIGGSKFIGAHRSFQMGPAAGLNILANTSTYGFDYVYMPASYSSPFILLVVRLPDYYSKIFYH